METSVTAFPPAAECASGSPPRPNGGFFIGVNDASATGAHPDGRRATAAFFLTDRLNPTAAAHFTRFSGTDVLNLPGLPTTWETHGDPSVDVADPKGAPPSSAHRLLYSFLLSTDSRRIADSVLVMRSDDCGGTWQWLRIPNPECFGNPFGTSPQCRHDHPFLHVDPRSTNVVYVVSNVIYYSAAGVGRSQPYVAGSIDGGTTFETFHPVATSGGDESPFFDSKFPVLASSQSTFLGGPLLMVWQSAHPCGTTGDGSAPAISWYISWSWNLGATWVAPNLVISGGSRCRVNGTVPDRSDGVYYYNRRPAFVVGANDHCIVGVSRYDAGKDSERVTVVESENGSTWNTVLDVPVGTQEGVTTRDQSFPVLSRNRFNPLDPHVLLAWYDARGSGNNAVVQLHGLSSDNNALVGSWGGLTQDELRAAIRAISDTPTQFEPGDRIGEYWGATSFLDPNGNAGYFGAWMDLRPATSSLLATATMEVNP